MDIQRMKTRIFLAVVMCMILLVSLSSATFAWFTANRQVETSRVESRTATEDVSLLISTKGGSDFEGGHVADIEQVNDTKMTYLLPVSTADLEHFVTCSVTTPEGYAENFVKMEKEDKYFHGRIYMMAKVSGTNESSTVSIYLDESKDAGGALVQREDEDSLILNAARLGLKFNEDAATSVIFRLSEEKNKGDDRKDNTKVDGKVLDDGYVLDSSGKDIEAVKDPAVLIEDYTIDDSSGRLPEKPLFTLQAGKIYPIDIYYYLEGCDADCTEAISFDGNELHLAFYGVLS